MTQGRDLQTHVVAFIRAFGLLQPDRTPCGLPISISMAHALAELAADDHVSQSEMAARLGLEKSTVSRLVSELLQRGWIERRRDPADGRIARLSLNDLGRQQADRLLAARADRFGQLAGQISPDEQAGVQHALRVLVDALQRIQVPDDAKTVTDR